MMKKTFQELVDTCKGPKSIVLGNGFGLSFDAATRQNNFNWNSLLDLCDIEVGSKLHGVLAACQFDFELAHQKLNTAIDEIKLYDSESVLIRTLEEQIQYLRDQLIIAVQRSHPPSFVQERSPESKEELDAIIYNCREFLNGFKNIFSLNYDLLLYWVRCYESNYMGSDFFTGDRDSPLTYSHPNFVKSANFFFPHGAVFIFREGNTATKSRSSKRDPILARVESQIERGLFPMCISEGTGEQKLEKIKMNRYLRDAFHMIRRSEGVIFTFGCSFLDGKDSHIMFEMAMSCAKHIVIGVYDLQQEERHRLEHEFEKVQNKVENICGTNRRRKTIHIVESSGTKIW